MDAFRRFLHAVRRHAAHVAVAATGLTVLVIGVILLPLPGPGTLVVVAGLAILATRFRWARRLLDALRGRVEGVADRFGWTRSVRHQERSGQSPGGCEQPRQGGRD